MKILVLNYEYPPLGGGGGSVSRQLSEHFVDRGHTVEVVTMAHADLPRHCRINGVDVTRVPALRRRPDICGTLEMGSYLASALPRVRARLRGGSYDVIHCHFVLPTGVLAYAATRGGATPYVVTAHGSDIPGFNPDRFRAEHHFTQPILRRILRHAALLTTPSRFLGDLIRERCGPFPAEHIPNGIDVSRFAFGPKKRRILMTGRLLRRKGFHHVLAALRNLETDFEVHIAGDGPMRRELEQRARDLKQAVTFHGWLDSGSRRMTELYESSSIFCLPSENENASMSLLEAMLAGAAVVTSDAPGCIETVGDAGFTVAPNDPEALRGILGRLVSSERLCAESGHRARRRAEEHFDWRRIGDRYLESLVAVRERAAGRQSTRSLRYSG